MGGALFSKVISFNQIFIMKVCQLNWGLSLMFFSLLVFQASAQKEREFEVHTIAFYNVENLFDTINDPLKNDEASPMMELTYQRGLIYQKKIKNMARAITAIGRDVSGTSPVIVGLSEVENRGVVKDLLNDPQLLDEDYGIVHYESPDNRGIDVALIYKKKLFVPTHTSSHELKIYDESDGYRIYTRDQLLVSGLLDGDPVHFIVNHWPSRSGGEARSRSRRIGAGKLAKHLVDSLQIIDPYAKIMIMGDFNDNPTDKSIKRELGTESDKAKVGLKGLYNPMELIFKKGIGSNAYRDSWSLFDQIIISEPLLREDYSSFRYYKAGVFNDNFLVNPKGQYKGYPFRSFTYAGFTDGFSDHFPAYIYLIREKL